MTSPFRPTEQGPPPSRGRRFVLWFVVVTALAVGIALAFLYGPRVVPFLDQAR